MKKYETPEMELLEIEAENIILASQSGDGNPSDGNVGWGEDGE